MALISMRQMLDHAAEHGYGVPAFNVNNLEQMRAIMEGGRDRQPRHRAGVGGRAKVRAALPAPPHPGHNRYCTFRS